MIRKAKNMDLKIDYRINSFLALVGILFIISCDPVKNVLITNKTGQNVKVKITQDPNQSYSLGSSTEMLYFLTKLKDSASETKIYQIGGFSKEDVKSFNDMVKEIKIIGETDSCTITGEKLDRYLPKKPKGLFKNNLVVKIKNCPK